MGLSQSEEHKSAEDAEKEEESKCLLEESSREGEKSDEGTSAGNVVIHMYAEAIEDGYFWVD